MDKKYSDFQNSIKKGVEFFKTFDNSKTIKLISHLDADGISAASLMVKLLNKLNKKYSLSIYPQVNSVILDEIAMDDYEYFIFTDLGSGQLPEIKEKLKGKKIIILDHHELQITEDVENIVQINPHLFKIKGDKEISGSGVVYSFVREIDSEMEKFAHIALIGAIGDMQEDKGFLYLNNQILETAIKHKKIDVRKGLAFFGIQTRPLYKILEYSTDPYVPEVCGSESKAIQFLQDMDINPKIDKKWKKITDLTDEETKKLAAGIIMKRVNETNPEDIFGNIYTLTEEKEGLPFKDIKEFSTLLNACGRLGRASLGIGCCLNDPKVKKRALAVLKEYKKEIVNALKWHRSNQDNPEFIINQNGYRIINAKEEVMPTMIGTLASIVSRSNDIKQDTYIMSMARNFDDTTKISLRTSCLNNTENLRELVEKIVEKVGGESGGHMNAAGAIIPTKIEEAFIEEAKIVLGKKAMEEIVV